MRSCEASFMLLSVIAACGRAPRADDRPTNAERNTVDAQVRTFVSDARTPTPDALREDPEVSSHIHTLAGEDGFGVTDAEEWLAAHPERSRPWLLAELRPGVEGIHVDNVLILIGRIGHPDDVPLLREWLLASGGKMWTFGAAKALELHPDPTAEAALIEGLEAGDADLISKCVRALGRRRGPNARTAIERFLDHADRSLRIAAINALRDLGVEPSRALLEARQAVETDAYAQQRLAEVLAAPPVTP